MMKTHFSILVLLISCFFALADQYIVPYSVNVPVIDGQISENEWDTALLISGAGAPIDNRRSQIYLLWTEQHVYFRMSAATPPRDKLIVTGGEVIFDDSLEIWIAPPEDLRTLELNKFGLFQFIVNSRGKLYTRHHNPGYGLSARKWQAELQIASNVSNGTWEMEIAIPAEAFGIRAITPSTWRILPVQNFRTQPEKQAPYSSVISYSDSSQYAEFHFEKGPTVQHTYCKASHIPALMQIKGFDTTNNLTVEIDGKSQSKTFSAEENTIDLSRYLPSGTRAVTLTLKDNQAKIIFQRSFNYAPPAERIWFTPESYLTLEHNFTQGIQDPDLLPPNSTPVVKGTFSRTDGRTKNSPGLSFPTAAESFEFRNCTLPVPGSISLWVRLDSPIVKGFRRFFGTRFSEKGYLGFQEQEQYMLAFLHNFSKEPINLVIPKKPSPGEWTNIIINYHPDKIEYFQNGSKLKTASFDFSLTNNTIGDFVLGGGQAGFSLDDISIYSRCLTQDEILNISQGEKDVIGDISLYPSINSLVADLTCKADNLDESCNFEVNLHNSEGQRQFQGEIPLAKAWKKVTDGSCSFIIHQALPLDKKLPDGDYFLTLVNRNNNRIILEKTIKVSAFPWLNNDIGRRDQIIPPFTPLEVAQNKISCVLRDYYLGASGLPHRITAAGKDILAGPIRLIAANDRKTSPLLDAKLEFQQTSDTAATYTGKATGDFDVSVTGRCEFDGMFRLDMSIRKIPGASSNRLYLDIPVKKEFAVLFHAVGEGIRSNPAGFIPSGQGVIWKSRIIPQHNYTNFIPYLWFGDDERGICYAADWDKDWEHCQSRDAVELFRHPNGDVSLRINFLNEINDNKERHISLALMASPVKPQPQGWRGWSDGFFFNGTKVARCLYSPPYWGSFTDWTSHYPSFKDFSYIQKLNHTLKTGIIDEQYKATWIRRVLESRPKENPTRVISHTNTAFEMARQLSKHHPNAILYPYSCNAELAKQLEEYPVMIGEWGGGVRVSQTSYADYSLYYLREMLKAGFNGIYNDNTFFVANFNWATGDAFIDETGNIRPSLGLWKNREYIKREVFLMHELGLDPWLTVHHTNANILPVLSMATNTMGMEWKYGINDFQERFSPDYIRAVCQGRQGGFFPTVLDGIAGGDKTAKTWATRTMLASLLPHEVRPTCPRESDASLYEKIHNLLLQFGIHENNCTYTAYWDSSNPVKTDDSRILASTYLRNNKLLLCCGSYAPLDTEVVFRFSIPVSKAKNLETGHTYPISDAQLSLPIKCHDLLLLEVETEL